MTEVTLIRSSLNQYDKRRSHAKKGRDEDAASVPDTQYSYPEYTERQDPLCSGYKKKPWKTEPCRYYVYKSAPPMLVGDVALRPRTAFTRVKIITVKN